MAAPTPDRPETNDSSKESLGRTPVASTQHAPIGNASDASSTRRLIILSACVALVLFAFRARPEDGLSPEIGATIVGGSLLALAITTFAARAKELHGSPVRVSKLIWTCLALRSGMAAAMLIGASLVAFFGFYSLNDRFRTHRTHEQPDVQSWGLIFGIAAALVVGRGMREVLCMSERKPARLLWLLPVAPLAVIGFVVVSMDLKERWTFCRAMAENQAEQVVSAPGHSDAWQRSWLAKEYKWSWLKLWLPAHPTLAPPPAGRRQATRD